MNPTHTRWGLGPFAAFTALLLGAGCARTTLPTAPLRSTGVTPRSGAALPPPPYAPDRLVLRCGTTSDEDGVEAQYSLVPLDRTVDAVLCAVPAGTDPLAECTSLSGDGRVLSAQPDYLAESAESRGHSWACDDGSPVLDGVFDQSAVSRVGLPAAHAVTRGMGVTVAVLDTGVDPTHPMLEGHLAPGWDFVDNDADPTEAPQGIDSNGDGVIDGALGHGSHVSGIVALVAPAARILPLRVLDSDGRGSGFAVAQAVDWAVAHGARVLNLSLGMLVEDDAIKNALLRAQAKGAVIVASAGNWGADSPEEFPASTPPSLAIAATDSTDRPTAFTSFGSFVALCAPGDHIRSAYWNGHTAVWSGTSMSAPWVSGCAALVLSLHPSWDGSAVLARLGETATPLPPGVPEAGGNFGAGLLDAAAAVAPGVGGGVDEPRLRRTLSP